MLYWKKHDCSRMREISTVGVRACDRPQMLDRSAPPHTMVHPMLNGVHLTLHTFPALLTCCYLRSKSTMTECQNLTLKKSLQIRKHKFLNATVSTCSWLEKNAGVPVFSIFFSRGLSFVSPLPYCHQGRSAPSPPFSYATVFD